MKIQTVKPFAPLKLHIIAEDGRQGIFDLTPYLKYEVFFLYKILKLLLK